MFKLASIALMAMSLPAADLVVRITQVRSDKGEIGCALYASAKGFPMDASAATAQWHKANKGEVLCRFEGLAPGTYAIAVGHDLNGNRKTDTKLFGIPSEDWGVSNNIRPRLRPPTFAEAAFQVEEGKAKTIEVSVGR